jgi:Fe-S-cluster-containing dehydrogenase component/DMSO reductase anchor subunit
MSAPPLFTIEPAAPSYASTMASGESLLERLLREQQDLSAVEQFARHHAPSDRPAAEQFYRTLLPATPPGPGQQYGFEVDLDCCSGCKACVTACHSLNGLDESETWRDVGLLIGGTRSLPVLQHVTTACHHCLSPACLVACPVNAYEKDPITGIVKHLDDQCFGCQYCTLACPYDVPKYHAGKGIVRKCDMCSTRLSVGEAPACVQACPHQAISIQVVDVAAIREDAEAAVFLPTAPDPRITFPTTTYKTIRVFPRNMLAADYFDVSPQHPHMPLVVMLVLTQLSVGAFAADLWLEHSIGSEMAEAARPAHGLTALFFGLVALGASTLHLGRPQYAYRALLGLRHSWMSREILAFSVFAALACAFAAAVALPAVAQLVSTSSLELLRWAVLVSGASAVFGSVMIYATLGREFWSFTRTFIRFALTAGLLGAATVWLTMAFVVWARPTTDSADILTAAAALCCPAIAGLVACKLAWEAAIFRHLLSPSTTQLKRTARLMVGELANVTLARFAAGIFGGLLMPAVIWSHLSQGTTISQDIVALLSVLLFVACVAGELGERYLYFAAVAAPRMPGGVR